MRAKEKRFCAASARDWRRGWRAAALSGWCCVLGGCGGAAQPAGLPHAAPTPTSVSKDNPGGDADDPDKAALLRLLAEPLGALTDKFETLRAAFPDWPNWRRVRFIGYPLRAGFRYGDRGGFGPF